MKKETMNEKTPFEKAAVGRGGDEKPKPDEKVGQTDGSVKEKVIQIADALKKRLAK